MIVTKDLLEGLSLNVQGATQRTYTRTFGVELEDADLPTDEDGVAGLCDAILAHADIPAFGEAHPTNGDVIAIGFNVENIDKEKSLFRVMVTYGYPEPINTDPDDGTDPNAATIHVGSTVVSTKTNLDKDGNKIVLTLTGHKDQVAEIDVQVPQHVLIFRRLEDADPRSKSAAFTGKVNDSSIGGYATRTLMCLGIEGDSSDGGLTYMVEYRFQYDPDTWDLTPLYTDDDGRPHNDIDLGTPGEGWLVTEFYPTADFDNLYLQF